MAFFFFITYKTNLHIFVYFNRYIFINQFIFCYNFPYKMLLIATLIISFLYIIG